MVFNKICSLSNNKLALWKRTKLLIWGNVNLLETEAVWLFKNKYNDLNQEAIINIYKQHSWKLIKEVSTDKSFAEIIELAITGCHSLEDIASYIIKISRNPHILAYIESTALEYFHKYQKIYAKSKPPLTSILIPNTIFFRNTSFLELINKACSKDERLIKIQLKELHTMLLNKILYLILEKISIKDNKSIIFALLYRFALQHLNCHANYKTENKEDELAFIIINNFYNKF